MLLRLLLCVSLAGNVLFALLIVQANTGMLSGYRRDATVRSVGVRVVPVS